MCQGAIAGFDVILVINEPVAAIAELPEASSQNQRLLVIDFGGWTLDVTVMDMSTDGGKRSFKVTSTHCDMFLGGVDFGREIAQMAPEQIGEKFPLSTSRTSTPPGMARMNSIVKGKLRNLRKLALEANESHLEKDGRNGRSEQAGRHF